MTFHTKTVEEVGDWLVEKGFREAVEAFDGKFLTRSQVHVKEGPLCMALAVYTYLHCG